MSKANAPPQERAIPGFKSKLATRSRFSIFALAHWRARDSRRRPVLPHPPPSRIVLQRSQCTASFPLTRTRAKLAKSSFMSVLLDRMEWGLHRRCCINRPLGTRGLELRGYTLPVTVYCKASRKANPRASRILSSARLDPVLAGLCVNGRTDLRTHKLDDSRSLSRRLADDTARLRLLMRAADNPHLADRCGKPP